MQSSAGFIKFFKPIELMIIVEGKIYKNFINTSLRSENVLISWIKFSIKIANKRDVYSEPKRFIQCCCEQHFLSFVKK